MLIMRKLTQAFPKTNYSNYTNVINDNRDNEK